MSTITYYVNFWVAKLVGFKWEYIFLCWNIGQTNNELKVNNEIPCRQYFAFFTHFHLLYILFKLANLLYSGRRARSWAHQSCMWLCLGWTLEIPRTWENWKRLIEANMWFCNSFITLSTKENVSNPTCWKSFVASVIFSDCSQKVWS